MSLERDPADEEDDENDVGEGGGEVDDLAWGLDAFHKTEEHEGPGEEQAQGQLPADHARFSDVARFVQHAIPEIPRNTSKIMNVTIINGFTSIVITLF